MPSAIPTRGPLDLGAALTNVRTPVANELSAVHVERIKDRIIELATELGLTDGSTPGSVWEALAAAGGGALPVVLVTGPDTEALPETDALVVLTTASGAVTLSLPAPADNPGRRYNVIRVNASGSNTVTLARNASEQINGTAGNLVLPGSGTGDRGEWVVWCDETNWWVTGGAGLDRSLELRETSGPTALTLGAIADGEVVVRSGTTLAGSTSFGNPWAGLTLTEQAGDPLNTANTAKLVSKDVGGITHLFVVLSDGTSIRVTGTATAPSNLGRAASAGTLGSVANADHVHDRGAIVGGSAITSTPTALPDQDYVPVDTTSAAIVLQLPAGSTYRRWEIAKINAGANKITLDPAGSETIQGGSAGANYDLPDSTSTTFPSWTLIRDTSGNFRVL